LFDAVDGLVNCQVGAWMKVPAALAGIGHILYRDAADIIALDGQVNYLADLAIVCILNGHIQQGSLHVVFRQVLQRSAAPRLSRVF